MAGVNLNYKQHLVCATNVKYWDYAVKSIHSAISVSHTKYTDCGLLKGEREFWELFYMLALLKMNRNVYVNQMKLYPSCFVETLTYLLFLIYGFDFLKREAEYEDMTDMVNHRSDHKQL